LTIVGLGFWISAILGILELVGVISIGWLWIAPFLASLAICAVLWLFAFIFMLVVAAISNW
jgi:hypothetical protein